MYNLARLTVSTILGVAVSCGLPLVRQAIAQQKPAVTVKTYTYKRVGDLAIKADVHRAADEQVRPVVFWIHGGALINGNREGISGRMKKALLESGYGIVSIDYRLAPETQLPEIVKDVEDAYSWLHKQASSLRLDASRTVVMGGSAGGYLTLTCGFRAKPRPAALVAFWGYGDLVGAWYSQPSPHPRHRRIVMTREQAYRQVVGKPISDSRDRQGNGGAFYQYCRQQGSWPQAVSGWNPQTQPEKFFPFMPVKNVNRQFPPTLLIHGTDDTDVPYQQSELMAAQFKRHGVEHELVSIAGGEHGLAGGKPEKIDAAYTKALAFTKRFAPIRP